MLDSGVCRFYSVEWDESKTKKRRTLRHMADAFFGERTVGVTRHYEAARNDERVDRLIRVWRMPVSTREICVIDGLEYLIRQVQPTTDKDGLLVTDLALEENRDA